MNLLLALSLAAAPALSDASLVYRGPTSKKAAASKYTFTEHAVGAKLRCAVDGANLRPSAGIDGEPKAQVPFGDLVEILQVAGEAVRVQDRVDRWYRVKTSVGEGFLFGNTLTPLYFEADLDGDGADEQITVAYTARLSTIVRVFEPTIEGKGRIHGGVVRLSKGRTRGGELRAAVHTRAPHWGAVEVQECHKKKCASGAVGYVHGKKALGTSTRSTQRGESVLGWSFDGLTLGGWKHLYRPTKRSLKKAPCEGCKELARLARYGEPEVVLEVEIEGYPRGPSVAAPCTALGTLEGGPYDGEVVVNCPLTEGGKVSPPYVVDNVFVRKGDWKIIGKLHEDLRAGFKQRGIVPRPGRSFKIAGLHPPELLRKTGFSELRFKRIADDQAEFSGEPAFVDPRLGPVYATADGYRAAHPHFGQFLFDWNHGYKTFEGRQYNLRHRPNSGEMVTHYSEVDPAAFAPAGKTPNGLKIFAPRDATNPLYEEIKETLDSARGMGWTDKLDFPTGNEEELHAARAVVVTYDTWGRQIALVRTELIPPLLAEPMLYLYPERETEFALTVGGEVGFARSLPPATGSSWTGRATPTGELVVNGARVDRLFWEGYGQDLPLLPGALVLTPEDARDQLADLAERAGLLGREVREFVVAWAPRAIPLGRARVRVMDPRLVNERVPLEVSPSADTVLRLYIELSRADDGARATPIAIPAPAARRGFVVVEWGGIER